MSSLYGLRRIFNGEPRKTPRGAGPARPEGHARQVHRPGRRGHRGEPLFRGQRVVYVDHGEGVVSMYCHLSAIDVKPGQRVEAGQKLGEIGATGRVTGPHLHFGLVVLGQAVDPLPLVSK